MSRYCIQIKTGLKLLFRNKGFLFFLIIVPILSLFILNIRIKSTEYDIETDASKEVVKELKYPDSKLIYLSDASKFSVKVFDSSNSKISDYLLNKLTDMGMFEIYRYCSEDMTEEQIQKMSEENALSDRIGAILYIKPDFDKMLFLENVENSIVVFGADEDERRGLFMESLNEILTILTVYTKETGVNHNNLEVNLLEESKQFLPEKTIKMIHLKEEEELSLRQAAYLSNIGYTIAVLSFAFLFCGVFIAHTVIEEKDYGVLTRITLSSVEKWEYIVSKLVITVCVTVIQTMIIGFAMPFIVHAEIGISHFSYLCMIFMLGLIFNMLSLCIGAIVGNIMNTNFIVFIVWSMSSLLAGVYFTIEMTGIIDKLSKLTPQKWFLEGARMLMLGDKSAYSMMFTVTIAFIIVIMSIGAAGLKFKSEV